MSIRCSNSPTLRLEIASSGQYARLASLVAVCSLFTLYLLYQRGYPLLAVLLSPAVPFWLQQLRRDSLAGTTLLWRQGAWSVERGGELRTVAILPESVSMGRVIYLVWREMPDGVKHRCWLFPDCAGREQLRRLRVRLALQR